MNIDDFVSKAVSQVRNAKTTGKKGRSARKSLRDDNAKLAAIKQEIIDMAIACEQRAWRDIRLVVRRYTATCSCCKVATQTCDSIYLEQQHKKLGTLLRRLDQIQVYSFPGIPREIEIHEADTFICGECFLQHTETPIAPGYHEPHPREFKQLSKWQQEYAIFSLSYDRRESWAAFTKQYLSPQLQLEHLS